MTALVVLLGFYLSDVYKSEEERISKEANYIFVSAVDKARGDALEEILKQVSADSTVDTISIMSFEQADRSLGRGHSSIQIKVAADSGETMDVVKEMRQLKDIEDLLGSERSFKMRFLKDTQFTGAVDEQLKARLKDEGLKIRYDIMVNDSVRMSADTVAYGLEEQFDFSVQQSPIDIIKKMWKEILFSIVVFFIVGMSFYFLEKSYKEQVSLNEARDQFVQNMTHELKSPVAAIGVALEAMESFGDADEVQRKNYLKNSRNEIARLDGLIDKVMETSSIKNVSEGSVILERVELAEILESISQRIDSAFPEKEIQINLSGIESNYLMANKLMLKGILNNILENAIKYGFNSGINIGVWSESKGEKVIINIRDNGPGINSDISPYIFDRFYRGQKGNTYDVAGYGLGLSLAREYARAMGGNIEFIPDEPIDNYEGAHFRVTLPRG